MSLPDGVIRAGGRASRAVHAAADAAGLLGPDDTFWNGLRRRVLPVVDAASGGRVRATGRAKPERCVGTVPMPEREVGELLAAAGFERNPFSALKLRDGEPEAGSWALRDPADESRQVHAVLFDADGGTDVHVHEEYSSIDPAVAPEHYRALGVDDEVGVAFARSLLPVPMSPVESREGSLVDSLGSRAGPAAEERVAVMPGNPTGAAGGPPPRADAARSETAARPADGGAGEPTAADGGERVGGSTDPDVERGERTA